MSPEPSHPDPGDLIPFPNGILNWRTGEFHPATPMLFSPHAAGITYNPRADRPKRWHDFLNEVFKGETDQIETLQEVFGYCLTSDISFHKIFLLIGPKRSGKGTIAAVLQSLLAEGTVAGPNLASLSGTFGLQTLIGTQLAIIDDIRFGKSTDRALVSERLLTISGGGHVSVDRKFLGAWQGILRTKFLLISNQMPDFADNSGALAARFVSLETRDSFYGREDHGLHKRLLAEGSGILLWALEGTRRLFERDSFKETDMAREMRQRLVITAAAPSPPSARRSLTGGSWSRRTA